jgi:magnesium chelatase subunit I
VVEREGLSIRHPARFVLVGSGNPEEGELRPQLLDRFGLSVEVQTPRELATRMQIVRSRDAFERDRAAFVKKWQRKEGRVRRQIQSARENLDGVDVPDRVLELAARLCMALGTDGLRGELTLIRAARALASLEGREVAGEEELRKVAPSVLRHRLRRDPLDEAGSGTRIERAMEQLFS